MSAKSSAQDAAALEALGPRDFREPPAIKTVCMQCTAVISDGVTTPEGLVSHGICDDCSKAWRAGRARR